MQPALGPEEHTQMVKTAFPPRDETDSFFCPGRKKHNSKHPHYHNVALCVSMVLVQKNTETSSINEEMSFFRVSFCER